MKTQLKQEEPPEQVERFEKLEKIGEGSYGTVWKAWDRLNSNKLIALKICKDPFKTENEGISAVILREISILSQLDHPNIVKLLHIETAPNKTQLAFEFMETDLRKALYFQNALEEKRYEGYFDRGTRENDPRVKAMLKQLLEAIDYLHGRRMMHRDIKPQNILVSKDLAHLKLADFGLSRVFNLPFREMSNEIVTLWYRAPELLLGENNYGVSVDLWSIGCVFYELVYNEPFCKGDTQVDQLFKILRRLGKPTRKTYSGFFSLPGFIEGLPNFKGESVRKVFPYVSEPSRSLLSSFLQINPLKRITAKAALAHPYFRIDS